MGKKIVRGAPVGYDGVAVEGLGYMLGTARVAKGLTLRLVAHHLKVSIQFISNIEHGRAPLPAIHVARLSNLLGLNQSVVAALALQKTKTFRDLKKLA